MRRDEREWASEARWLDSLRNGYTDVHPIVGTRRSFDAQWADGGWAHDPHPEMLQEPARRPVPDLASPPLDSTAAAGRTFFAILFWFTLATSLELWWLNTSAESITDLSGIFLAIGRITGLVGGFVLLFQVLLMSRVGWLERWIGAHDLLVWHRELGGFLLIAILAHVVATILGYASGSEVSFLHETWSMVSSDLDMITASLATALLVAVAVMSIRGLRRLMSYEKWYHLHLTSYLIVLLGYAHQFSAGQELMNPGFGRVFWIGLHVFVLACLAWGRVFGPIMLNARHRLQVLDVVQEAPGMISIYIGGRGLGGMRARAGQYFRWRFFMKGCWWQAHPFSLSAAPNNEWLRLTVKVVGDHTRDLQRLRAGVRVFAEGPSGVFTADRSVKRRALLIAGGSGIAPIRALLEDLPAGTIMIYRAGSAREILFREELDWLAQERRAYIWYVLGSRDDPGPRHLFTPNGMRDLVPDLTRRDVFLCGPRGLVDASKTILKKLRVPKRQIHLDPFEF
jgi:predicted ferric reductase